jgi:hypothetical protein
MSLIDKMKMKCNIYRQSTNIASRQDSRGNISSDYPTVPKYRDVKCNIQNYDLTSGKYVLIVSGNFPNNKLIGYFKPDQDILTGDKITCSIFKNDFYVVSVDPIVNILKNKVHHIECELEII